MLSSVTDINDKQAGYFISFNTIDWVDIFIRPVYKQVIVHTLNHFIDSKGLRIYAWCLMSSQLHIIAQAQDDYLIETIDDAYRSFTSAKIVEALDAEPQIRKQWMLERFEKAGNNSKSLQIWQNPVSPVLLDLKNIASTQDYFQFIHDRPVRDRCVDLAIDYLYSSARDYAGIKGLVNICRIPGLESQLSSYENSNDSYFIRYIRN
jgi:REP element-mobilizing transposase RayT